MDGSGFGEMTQARWFAPPVVQIDVAFAEAMPALENVMLHAAYAPALVKTKVAFPPETVWGELRGTTSPPDAPMQEEVVVAAIWCELSPVTVAPLASSGIAAAPPAAGAAPSVLAASGGFSPPQLTSVTAQTNPIPIQIFFI